MTPDNGKRRELEAAAARRRLEEEALAEAANRAAAGDQETAELILEHAVHQTKLMPEFGASAAGCPGSRCGSDNTEGSRLRKAPTNANPPRKRKNS
jgi:hypothetical protein